MTSLTLYPNYALAIRSLEPGQFAPVVYELNGSSTEIGTAEDNHIVLDGMGVEPYHLALRQIGAELVLMVDWSLARQEGPIWKERHPGDRLYCASHGTIPEEMGSCPRCDPDDSLMWLVRPIQAGDTFPIGQSFEATVLSQGKSKYEHQVEHDSSPWPDLARLSSSALRPAVQITSDPDVIEDRPYPIDDSNLWLWSPPDSPLPIFIHQRANRYVSRHACRNSDREVGGVLLGHVYRDPGDDLLYPVITDAVVARFATEARGHLTFTHETWRDLNRQREKHFPNKRVVGWYHTHPGLDIFLSQMDLFVHRNFFRQPWQVAMVIDPRQDLGGFFVWSGGDLLDPQKPHQLFRTADLEEEHTGERRGRVRIKLGERVE